MIDRPKDYELATNILDELKTQADLQSGKKFLPDSLGTGVPIALPESVICLLLDSLRSLLTQNAF